ncbi:Os12g0117001 [Oryza sativa Japonica Group]|uniref:Os12g0117001 protein n=1 Tax=Oryza sativa subsp. japonica TaxID=39947 RepID=A0A0P0Y6G9_ORYSJ|nr:Os12g0117001 [Oryza sativa Japonica Group]
MVIASKVLGSSDNYPTKGNSDASPSSPFASTSTPCSRGGNNDDNKDTHRSYPLLPLLARSSLYAGAPRARARSRQASVSPVAQ